MELDNAELAIVSQVVDERLQQQDADRKVARQILEELLVRCEAKSIP